MQTKLSAALFLGLSGTFGILFAQPSKAGPNPPLANCVISTLDDLLNSGCTRGDKNFIFNSYTGDLPADQVTVVISGFGNSYTLNFTPSSFWSGTGSLDYTIEVNNTSTDLLSSLSGAQSTSQVSSLFTGNVVSSGSNPGTCGSSVAVTSWSCATTPLTYPFGLTSTNVTNNWNAPGGLNSIINTINQQPVPGPLAILGAGTAYGFSRKLRRRTRACR